jgi:hypothetical protein
MEPRACDEVEATEAAAPAGGSLESVFVCADKSML